VTNAQEKKLKRRKDLFWLTVSINGQRILLFRGQSEAEHHGGQEAEERQEEARDKVEHTRNDLLFQPGLTLSFLPPPKNDIIL
jgi:hypothetical protein